MTNMRETIEQDWEQAFLYLSRDCHVHLMLLPLIKNSTDDDTRHKVVILSFPPTKWCEAGAWGRRQQRKQTIALFLDAV